MTYFEGFIVPVPAANKEAFAASGSVVISSYQMKSPVGLGPVRAETVGAEASRTSVMFDLIAWN